MKFVLQMAVRETRAAWRRLLFFFVCIAVGVAAIVALRSVIQNVREIFGREAKALVAADVVINTNRDLTDTAKALIDRRLAEAQTITRTETISTPTMVRPADESLDSRADGRAEGGRSGVSAVRPHHARRRSALLARAARGTAVRSCGRRR